MSRGRAAVLLAALCCLSALVLPSLASARIAYVTGSGFYNAYAVPVELTTGTIGSQVPIGATEGTPPDVAISPDGKTAYVVQGATELLPIDVATNTAGTPIETGLCANEIAIKPDGTTIYVTNTCEETVSVINAATGTEELKITVGAFPSAIAVTPDGTRAYVSSDKSVIPIDLASNTPGTPIPVGEFAGSISVTPNGTAAYVTVSNENAIKRIDLATNAVGPAIVIGGVPQQIAITPDSALAYAFGGDDPVTPVALATGTPGTPIPLENHFHEDIAITPDGTRAWLTDETQSGGDKLDSIEIPGNTLGSQIPNLERPDAIAIVPNQPPRASFTASPSPVLRGDTVNFDAGGSSDPDGNVARYVWDFGDGGDPVVGGATTHHTYAFGGTYTVTLTTTDNEGCSLTMVFPGQTAYCNGSAVARTTRQVQVNPKCIEVTGSASSFVPKYRSSRVVPGVRMRLSASAPSRLTVSASLSWSRGGGGSVELNNLVTNVQHWRRVRFVIPSKLRAKLPLGLPVTLKLQIEAAPLDETLCPGKVVNKTLHLRVVKVIPGSIQAGRTR